MSEYVERVQAVRSFRSARSQAKLSELTAKLTGKDDTLLPFDLIRAEMRLHNPLYRGVQMIPLEKIVGSVGRYDDFTRHFLPRKDNIQERWVGVETLAATQGWPPIDVYKVGELYFVKDGNHRTAVAHKMGNTTIEAHVWEYPDVTLPNFDEDAHLDDILIQLGEKRFMEETKLNERIPDHGIHFTTPGRYSELMVQIEELRVKLSTIDEEAYSLYDVVPLWYEMIYLPTVQIIRESTLLNDFVGRTESDLFAWLSVHRTRLADRYGEYDNLADLAHVLADRYRESGLGKVTRQMRNLLGDDALPPLQEE